MILQLALHFRWIVAVSFCLFAPVAPAAEPAGIHVGFGEANITPNVDGDKPVWMAGFGMGRRATGVHDPLLARAVVLRDSKDQKLALVSVDLVGLQYPQVLEIRGKLRDFAYVMVSSTHNHEAPDVIGIWGKNAVTSGVDPDYLKVVVERSVQAVRQAESRMLAVDVFYGTASDEKLLGDSRQPYVFDDVLRVLTFVQRDSKAAGTKPARGKLAGILMQWNCHPESMGSRNTLLTADFIGATVEALRKQYDVPVAYFTGTVGGLLAPPDHGVLDENGQELREGDFRYMQTYGAAVAKLASKAVDSSAPISLDGFAISSKPVAVPMVNPVYQLARTLGVLNRDGCIWTGDFEDTRQVVTRLEQHQKFAVVTEVAYLRLGELHAACIPGEIYPELVYGRYQEPADPGADFPDALLEKSVVQILPGKKVMLFGLANDEIGYIIPKRQWDQKSPYAYGRQKSQYGEINSVGPDAAPIVMQALEKRVKEAK